MVNNPGAGLYPLFGICLIFENCLNMKLLLMSPQMHCLGINWACFKKETTNASSHEGDEDREKIAFFNTLELL